MLTFKETLERQKEEKFLKGVSGVRTRGINPKESFRGRPGDLRLKWKRMSLGANSYSKTAAKMMKDTVLRNIKSVLS